MYVLSVKSHPKNWFSYAQKIYKKVKSEEEKRIDCDLTSTDDSLDRKSVLKTVVKPQNSLILSAFFEAIVTISEISRKSVYTLHHIANSFSVEADVDYKNNQTHNATVSHNDAFEYNSFHCFDNRWCSVWNEDL